MPVPSFAAEAAPAERAATQRSEAEELDVVQVTASRRSESVLDVPMAVTVVDADTFTTTDLWGVATTASGTTAARVYTIASPYVEADLFNLHFAQSADVITLTHPSYSTRELKRLGATNWTLTTLSFAAPTNAPTDLTGVPPASAGR